MTEFVQYWEKNGQQVEMVFDFCSERYMIYGYGIRTLRFTDIYDANKYMTEHGWK